MAGERTRSPMFFVEIKGKRVAGFMLKKDDYAIGKATTRRKYRPCFST